MARRRYDHAAVCRAVWEHLSAVPGLTAFELARVLGYGYAGGRYANTGIIRTALAELARDGCALACSQAWEGPGGYKTIWVAVTSLPVGHGRP